jgi:hypothetical protein
LALPVGARRKQPVAVAGRATQGALAAQIAMARELLLAKTHFPTAAAALAFAQGHGLAADTVIDAGQHFRVLAHGDPPAAAATPAPAPAADEPASEPDSLEFPVFEAGTWHGQSWPTAALDAMVQNFERLKRWVKPPLKLGHDDQQQFLAQADGQPALGWVEALRREGTRLLARVRGVPKALRELIAQGRYRRVSAELYPAWEHHELEQNLHTGTRGPVLAAVALLGADIPVVKTLDDLPRVLAMEGATFATSPTAEGAVALATVAAPDQPVLPVLVSPPKEWSIMADAHPSPAPPQAPAAPPAEVAALEAALAAERAERQALEERLRYAEAAQVVEALSSPAVRKLLPHQRALATTLLATLPATPVRFGEGAQARERPLRELFREFLESLPPQPELTREHAEAGAPATERPAATVQERLDAAVAATAKRLGVDVTQREGRLAVFRELARSEPELVREAALQPPVLDGRPGRWPA